jgi:hypothetical protein
VEDVEEVKTIRKQNENEREGWRRQTNKKKRMKENAHKRRK